MIEMEHFVRRAMVEETDGMHLRPDAATRALRTVAPRRSGRRRLGIMAAAGVAFALAGTGIAAAFGVMPWVRTEVAVSSSPFATAPDPAAVAGSRVRLTVAGPEGTRFELVSATERIGGRRMHCTAVAVEERRGQWQHLTTSCGAAGALTPRAATIDWQAPSGAGYLVVTGPSPTPEAATVSLATGHGTTTATEHLGGGYYLVYAPARTPSPGRLVFRDTEGNVIARRPLGLHA